MHKTSNALHSQVSEKEMETEFRKIANNGIHFAPNFGNIVMQNIQGYLIQHIKAKHDEIAINFKIIVYEL